MHSRFKDWGDVRIFLAVLQEGSTLAASRLLDINQSTVARRIDVLEHTLGVTLFEKTTRGACPTDVARHLQSFAESLAQAAALFETEAVKAQAKAAPPIRITAFDQMMSGDIGSIVAAFSDENPGTSFEFIAAERLLDLSKGEADVAIRMTGDITDDRLIARKLGDTAWTFYASKTYAERHEIPRVFSDDMGPHRIALLSHNVSNRKNVIRCATGNDLFTAIRSGQCIGPIPIHIGDNDPALVRCFDPPDGAEMRIWLVVSPEAYKRADVRKFTAYAAPVIANKLKAQLGRVDAGTR